MISIGVFGCGLNVMSSLVLRNEEALEGIDSVSIAHRRAYVAYSLAVFIVSLIAINLCHKQTGHRPLRKYKFFLQVLVACFYFAIPAMIPVELMPDYALLLLLAVISVLLVAFNLAESHYYAYSPPEE